MIDGFIDSWPLFQNTYLAAWMMGILLSIVGVLVVAREQIFIGAALSEASTLGIAVAFSLASFETFHEARWLEGEAFLGVMAAVFALVAAGIIGKAGSSGRESYEAATGWIFLLGGSLSIIIVYHTPHGLEEVHRLLSTSIIGASRADVVLFTVLAAAAVTLVAVLRRPLLLAVLDEEMAQAAGLRARAWSAGITCAVALSVSLCLRASGLPYTFGCLVLPPLAARHLCRSPGQVFVVSPVIALLTSAIAFILADHYDEPPGQVTVALLCALAAALAGGRRLLRAS
jgi:ABC-type Mn2+/Zn2+ transport system permease subunit